jgi:hypothetical protein
MEVHSLTTSSMVQINVLAACRPDEAPGVSMAVCGLCASSAATAAVLHAALPCNTSLEAHTTNGTATPHHRMPRR